MAMFAACLFSVRDWQVFSRIIFPDGAEPLPPLFRLMDAATDFPVANLATYQLRVQQWIPVDIKMF